LHAAALCALLLAASAAAADEGRRLDKAYARAADLLQFRVARWLTHHETWAAQWSADASRLRWRSTGPQGERWHWADAHGGKVHDEDGTPAFDVAGNTELNLAPGGTHGIGIEKFNLLLVDGETGARHVLTTDGTEDFSYATRYGFGVIDAEEWNAMHGPLRPARGVWSADGRRFATYRYDQRGVGRQFYWHAVAEQGYGARPRFTMQAASYPGDAVKAGTELVIVDIADRKVRIFAEPRLETLIDPVAAGLLRWSADGDSLYFLHEGRGLREVAVKRLDLDDGSIHELYTERSDTYLMLSGSRYPAIWSVLDNGRRLLWYSEWDGFGNLYRIDLERRAIQNPVTAGPGVVRTLLRVDEDTGTAWFLASGRERGVDPYYRQLYRATLDGSNVELLTPEPADHIVSLPAAGSAFLDLQSAGLGAAPKTVLRAQKDGRVRATLAEMDLAPLKARGWRPPERRRVRDADNRFDVYVSVFFPGDYDAARKYPVLDFIYGLSSLAESPVTFPPGADHELGTYYWRAQSMAEVGFIVVMMDATGTPLRGHEYARASWGEGHVDSTLRHHVAAIRQLANQDASFDLQRVGIFGHSGGGFTSMRAMLFYPEFFKVAVSSAGSHDLVRMYGPEWGDRYIGPYEDNRELYAQLSNSLFADRLQGKLLLAAGEADSEVTIAMTQQLVHALIDANKDFDLLYVPNADHDLGNHPYFIRRRWDYFVTHLLGETPPAGFRIER
jgi:dipeptidyl aminopeptidase/acylaminoacyl peptidase